MRWNDFIQGLQIPSQSKKQALRSDRDYELPLGVSVRQNAVSVYAL